MSTPIPILALRLPDSIYPPPLNLIAVDKAPYPGTELIHSAILTRISEKYPAEPIEVKLTTELFMIVRVGEEGYCYYFCDYTLVGNNLFYEEKASQIKYPTREEYEKQSELYK